MKKSFYLLVVTCFIVFASCKKSIVGTDSQYDGLTYYYFVDMY